jgi:hypothetical protein
MVVAATEPLVGSPMVPLEWTVVAAVAAVVQPMAHQQALLEKVDLELLSSVIHLQRYQQYLFLVNQLSQVLLALV